MGFPVGKVESKYLFPMNYQEFLRAIKKTMYANLLDEINLKNAPSESIHQKLIDFLLIYFVVGGMPEVIDIYSENQEHPWSAYTAVRAKQIELVNNYKGDIAKHSGKIKAIKIEAVFKSIPSQLAQEQKEHKKFVFKDILKHGNSNFQNLEGPVEWLIKAGLVKKVFIVEKAQIPLVAYAKENRFKLYLFDVGLLGAMLNLSPKNILLDNYGMAKVFFAENFVLNEMYSSFNQASANKEIYSWQSGKSEIDFLVEHGGEIIPIEVKSGINTKAQSLKVYTEKYNPSTKILLSQLSISGTKTNQILPLYLTSKLFPL
ncbi:MAG: DUF4143 domain-containing protein [Oligoflexia bacterium]|nr:DUF4143 domain-containing protein [Oligoflexia bacterium]